jgi:hypothetical protein
VFGTTNPPRVTPSAPSIRKLLAAGAETLGPVDTGDDSQLRRLKLPKPRRTWPVLIGIGVVAAGALATAMFVHNASLARDNPSSVTPPPAASQVTAPTATESMHVEPTATATTTATAEPTHTTTRPHHNTPSIHTAQPPQPSASAAPVISGISRDRK